MLGVVVSNHIQDTARRRLTREYFRLDTIDNPTAETWDRTLALARFVARNIPHANQSVQPERRNAIDLWEYTRNVEPAFNCRLHSIMPHELLLACDITNRYVTCLPADSLDQDCHVVNIVWLPEHKKWAMVDSDMRAYVTDSDGTPLSLSQMRERYINGAAMEIHPLLDEGQPFDYTYYRTYWSKNLYWFECAEQTSYDIETARGTNAAAWLYYGPRVSHPSTPRHTASIRRMPKDSGPRRPADNTIAKCKRHEQSPNLNTCRQHVDDVHTRPVDGERYMRRGMTRYGETSLTGQNSRPHVSRETILTPADNDGGRDLKDRARRILFPIRYSG